MRSLLDSRLRFSLRSASFAGRGLPERMRSTAFALFGLTAASGLLLVATFAQLDFSLLDPAPLPEEPALEIADARRLSAANAREPIANGDGAADRTRDAESGTEWRPDGNPASGAATGDGGSGGGTAAPAPAPAPAGAPAGSGSGQSGGGEGSADGRSPAPAGGSTPSPAPVPTPVAAPQPVEPVPEATASSPPPETAPAPGNSSSAAAAEHASERGIERSSASVPTTGDPGNGVANGPGR